MNKKKTENHMDYDYICSKCADKMGGKWPDGHVATFHYARCHRCDKKLPLAHHDDWNWEGQKHYPYRD